MRRNTATREKETSSPKNGALGGRLKDRVPKQTNADKPDSAKKKKSDRGRTEGISRVINIANIWGKKGG